MRAANTAYGSAYSDEFIPIDPTANYKLEAYAKSGDTGGGNFNAANRQYLGVACYDIDALGIDPSMIMKFSGSTDTTLAVDLVNGATTVTLTDSTGWQNASGAGGYERQFTYYGYTNSKGYTYPNYTYSRYTSVSQGGASYSLGAWAAGGITGNVITLLTPWTGGTVPAGTAIRNNTSGGTFKYIAMSSEIVPNAWTNYKGFIGGIDTLGTNDNNKFPYGAAYVKLLFLINYHGAADNYIRYSNLTFAESKNTMSSSLSMYTNAKVLTNLLSTDSAVASYITGNLGIGITGSAYKFQSYTTTAGDAAGRFINAATTGTGYGVQAIIGGAATTGYGLYASATGATNNYSIYIAGAGAGANNYAIYSSTGDKSYFSGSMGLGITTPAAKLHVISTTEQYRVGYDGSNYYSTTVGSTGGVTFDAVGSGAGFAFSDPVNITSSLQVDSIVNDTGLASGTYTPTLTGVTNVASSTARQATYMRVGNTVTVSGQIDVTPTINNTRTTIGVSLPIASNFSTAYQAGGSGHTTGNITAGHGLAIYSDATNDRVEFDYYETHGALDTFTYQFMHLRLQHSRINL